MHGDWNLFFPFYHLLSLAFELSVSQDFLREVIICLFVIAARELQDVICTVFFPVSFFFVFLRGSVQKGSIIVDHFSRNDARP